MADEEPQAILVLTTLAADADVARLARALVEERLAACVNILPAMTSVYRWKDAVEQEREQQVIVKTTPGRLEALQRRLHELHPYELPEFLVIEASGSSGYLGWLRESAG